MFKLLTKLTELIKKMTDNPVTNSSYDLAYAMGGFC